MRCGKKSVPVSAPRSRGVGCARTPVGASRWRPDCPEERGEQGADRRQVATRWGSDPGRLGAQAGGQACRQRRRKPAVISEKKTPIDSAIPEYWNVDRIPDATPRSAAGTLSMIEEVFGAENMPCPMPVEAHQARTGCS